MSASSEPADGPANPQPPASSPTEPQINQVSEASTSTSTQSKDRKKKFQPLTMPTTEQIMFEDIMNNCFSKTAISGVMGGVAGAALGLFTASIENQGVDDIRHADTPKPTRVVLKEMALNMRDKSWSYAKGFALFGALYSFNECVIEKFRAKHDKVNPTLAGCATGAMLAYSAGPKAMCLGCASVGAFSLAIEHFLES
mmetsp:Transcript_26975/g.58975  ORF Transcript_26975/g.58975 Transcript_26975/m.58975 type:complete len:198 (-) Transcript_26975:599-1192(-)